jgi:hypothetical protein
MASITGTWGILGNRSFLKDSREDCSKHQELKLDHRKPIPTIASLLRLRNGGEATTSATEEFVPGFSLRFIIHTSTLALTKKLLLRTATGGDGTTVRSSQIRLSQTQSRVPWLFEEGALSSVYPSSCYLSSSKSYRY